MRNCFIVVLHVRVDVCLFFWWYFVLLSLQEYWWLKNQSIFWCCAHCSALIFCTLRIPSIHFLTTVHLCKDVSIPLKNKKLFYNTLFWCIFLLPISSPMRLSQLCNLWHCTQLVEWSDHRQPRTKKCTPQARGPKHNPLLQGQKNTVTSWPWLNPVCLHALIIASDYLFLR